MESVLGKRQSKEILEVKDSDLEAKKPKCTNCSRQPNDCPVLSLSGLCFHGDPVLAFAGMKELEDDLESITKESDGNRAHYVPTSSTDAILPPKPSWSEEKECWTYPSKFTFNYRRSAFIGKPDEDSVVLYDHDSEEQRPMLFLHPKGEAAYQAETTSERNPEGGLLYTDIRPTQASRYTSVFIEEPDLRFHQAALESKTNEEKVENGAVSAEESGCFADEERWNGWLGEWTRMLLHEVSVGGDLGKVVRVVWNSRARPLWGVKLTLTPIKDSILGVDDVCYRSSPPPDWVCPGSKSRLAEYSITATVSEVYVKEAFFDGPEA